MQHHDTRTLKPSTVLFFSFILIIYGLVLTPDSPSVFVLIISPAYGKQFAVFYHTGFVWHLCSNNKVKNPV